ncbi:OLC1v1005027C1 [Oldenlandia corymbosa var. corymbosa]|uniref:OLC1v1005027C1 n=1 Tax=Oldenlandia corymbosa var. corymbosa TaxID=529605 RepID=A0AAV1DDQ8_OLDCO|nr:OLC1v1005027C1 [Oldenlandia corymbosa var. corymbosa]
MGRPRKNQEKQETNTTKNVVFKGRKEGLKKKAMELSILCDIPVLVMIRSPNGELEVWPRDPSQVKTIVRNYLNGRNPEKKNPPAERSDLWVEKANNLANVTENVDVKGKGLPRHNNQEEPEMGCGHQLIMAEEEENHMWDGIDYGIDELMLVPENQNNWGNADLIQGSNSEGLINNDHDSYFGWKQGLAPLGINFDDSTQDQQPLDFYRPDQSDLVDYYLWNNEKIDSFGMVNLDSGFDQYKASTQSNGSTEFSVF